MPDDSTRNIEDESTYPELTKPEFKSDIPATLLKDSSDTERYILDQLSIMRQFTDWSVNAQLLTHQSVRRTNGRVIRLETWQNKVKTIYTSWWGLILAVATIGGGIAGVVEAWHYIVEQLNK